MGNGKWKMGNGKWKMGNGKWKMENGKQKIGPWIGMIKSGKNNLPADSKG